VREVDITPRHEGTGLPEDLRHHHSDVDPLPLGRRRRHHEWRRRDLLAVADLLVVGARSELALRGNGGGSSSTRECGGEWGLEWIGTVPSQSTLNMMRAR
jgi:hypothetical protein